jgi:hypothetical protein
MEKSRLHSARSTGATIWAEKMQSGTDLNSSGSVESGRSCFAMHCIAIPIRFVLRSSRSSVYVAPGEIASSHRPSLDIIRLALFATSPFWYTFDSSVSYNDGSTRPFWYFGMPSLEQLAVATQEARGISIIDLYSASENCFLAPL